MVIAVLAVQGSFFEHEQILEKSLVSNTLRFAEKLI